MKKISIIFPMLLALAVKTQAMDRLIQNSTDAAITSASTTTHAASVTNETTPTSSANQPIILPQQTIVTITISNLFFDYPGGPVVVRSPKKNCYKNYTRHQFFDIP